MAEVSYVGVNNTARKITDMYVGINGVARKIAYAYVGVNGVAQRFYSSIKIKPFTSNIFPTNWQNVDDDFHATSTNDYGIWSIEGIKMNSSNNNIKWAFDGNNNTYVYSARTNDTMNLYIYLPENVSINPSTMLIRYRHIPSASTNKIRGYNIANNTWEDLFLLTGTTGSTIYTQIENITTDKYYSKFCVDVEGSTTNGRDVYEFQITAGNIKYKG